MEVIGMKKTKMDSNNGPSISIGNRNNARRAEGGSGSFSLKKKTVVTISPKSSTCTACATEFYEFTITNRRLVADITKLFYETLELESTLQDELEMPWKEQLPFCTNCLIEFNELRQMMVQLRKLNSTVSKLKDSLIFTTIEKINSYYEEPKNSRSSGSDSLKVEIRMIHEHIKKRSQHHSSPAIPSGSRIHHSTYSDSDIESDEHLEADSDFDNDTSLPGEYPLFVDIVEGDDANSNSNSQSLENTEVFDPLSTGNDNSLLSSDQPEDLKESSQKIRGKGKGPPPLVFKGSPSRAGLENRLDRQFRGFRRNDLICEPILPSASNDDTAIKEDLSEIEEDNDDSRNSLGLFGLSCDNSIPFLQDIDSGRDHDQKVFGEQGQELRLEINMDDPRAYIRENFAMCPICFKYTLKEGSNIEEHDCQQKSHTAHFQCGYCNQISQTERSVMTHMKQHLNDNRLRSWQNVSESSHSKLLSVFSAIQGPYPCPYCNRVFSRKSELIRGHILMQHGVRLKPFPCPVCGSAFRSKNDLQRHYRTHTGERPFACVYCNKTFTRKHHLTTHMVTHQKRTVVSRLEVGSISTS